VALTTLAIVKARLGIATANTSQDALLADLILEADDEIKEYLGQNIEQATYTEFYKGPGSNKLILRQLPVQSITSVHLDSDGYFGFGTTPFATADLLVAGTDYALDYVSSAEYSESGLLYRIGSVWPCMRSNNGLLEDFPEKAIGNIKVVYVAGYPSGSVPKRYQAMATKYVCWKFATDVSAGIMSSESISDTSYSYSLGSLEGKGHDEVLAAICGGAKEWVL